jgi:hypothetical protein
MRVVPTPTKTPSITTRMVVSVCWFITTHSSAVRGRCQPRRRETLPEDAYLSVIRWAVLPVEERPLSSGFGEILRGRQLSVATANPARSASARERQGHCGMTP